jgi:ribosomal protein L13
MVRGRRQGHDPRAPRDADRDGADGKHKPIYTPFLDTGDFVVVLNADKIKLSGKKAEKKFYKRFSGYPGGQREVPYAEEMAKHPDVVVLHAVKSMLPRGTLGRQQITKLKVYKGTCSSSPGAAVQAAGDQVMAGNEGVHLGHGPPQERRRPRSPLPRHRHHHRQPPPRSKSTS